MLLFICISLGTCMKVYKYIYNMHKTILNFTHEGGRCRTHTAMWTGVPHDASAALHTPHRIMGMRAPPNYGLEYQARFDAMYGELAAQYDTALIPFWLEDIYRDPGLFQNDRIHPTAEGIEELVASTIDEVAAAIPAQDTQ